MQALHKLVDQGLGQKSGGRQPREAEVEEGVVSGNGMAQLGAGQHLRSRANSPARRQRSQELEVCCALGVCLSEKGWRSVSCWCA